MGQNYTVIGLNAGLGVSLYPFKENLIANIETRPIFHTTGDEQWRANFLPIPLYKKFRPKEDSLIFKPDVLISSPDCGSGSILRFSRAKKLGDHKKNNSLLQFFIGVKYFKPKFFYFENLDGLYKSFKPKDFKDALPGYYLKEFLQPVSSWGNSQVNRKRLVIIGIRKDLPYKKIRKYFKLPKIKNLKTCDQLYGGLSPLNTSNGNLREPLSTLISIYGGKKLTLKQIQEDWQTRLKGKTRYIVPEEEGRKFKTAPGVYRNLKNSYPATARKANRQYDHHGLTLTPRQLARVQGVPDDFVIYINPDKLGYWINKARTVVTKTPPMEISLWFKKCLTKSIHLWHRQH